MSGGCSIPRPGRGSLRTSPSSSPSRRGTHFQEIEQRGGFVEARDFVAEQIAEVRAPRIDDIAHRRTALTGVNEYPNLAEPPLPHERFDVDRRALRGRFRGAAGPLRCLPGTHGSRPQVLLLPLGPLAEHNIRATFAANLLASGASRRSTRAPSRPPVSRRRFRAPAPRRSR